MMDNDKTVRLWTLLSKQEHGELSKEEAPELESLQADPLNQEALATYAMLKDYWKKLALEKGPDSAAYWQNQLIRLQAVGEQAKEQSMPNQTTESLYDPEIAIRPKWYLRKGAWLSAAAVALLAICLSLFFKHQNNPGNDNEQIVVIVHNGDQKQISLPEGSKVWLNSGSQLTYNKYFTNAPVKEITLKGEAFFDIRHDPNRTFIIHTEYLDIKDLGTQFNVKAYEDEDKMETSLLNGSVEVYLKNHPEKMIRLKPNEKVVFDTKILKQGKFSTSADAGDLKQKGLRLDSIENRIGGPGALAATGFYIAPLKPKIKSKGDSIVLETAWMQHQLAFSAETFNELAKNMDRWYDVQINITNPEVGNYIFSGIFKEENIQEALSELQMIQPFQFEIRGRQVRIY